MRRHRPLFALGKLLGPVAYSPKNTWPLSPHNLKTIPALSAGSLGAHSSADTCPPSRSHLNLCSPPSVAAAAFHPSSERPWTRTAPFHCGRNTSHAELAHATSALPPQAWHVRRFSAAPEADAEEMVKAEVVFRDRVPVRPVKPGKEGAKVGAREGVREGAASEDVELRVGVGLITLSRPKVLNALCEDLMWEFCNHLDELQSDPQVGAVVVTGQGKAFAAGADIAEMAGFDFPRALSTQLLSSWEEAFARAKKPVIAAVNGFALGGGCELAMMCDVILAGERARFGQPEVTLGTIPGMGGTQRLVRAVGKSRAMEMVLSGGGFLEAHEAVQCGLVSRVVPGDNEALLEEALALGARIASLSQPVVALAKECVSAAYDATLHEGVMRERTAFYATFALRDRQEGMSAFVEKREPRFRNK